MTRARTDAPILLAAYAALALANVAGHLADTGWLAVATKPLLMPVLAAWLWLQWGGGPRLVRLALLALVFSWLGDLALMGAGEGWFLAGIGAFALAQTVYLVAFWPAARTGLPRRRPLVFAPYLVVWAAMVALLAGRAGELFLPAAAYGLLLVVMAGLALGVHPWTAWGAALFVVSDALIALTGLLDVAIPASGALVMATYTAAQGLIVLGVSRAATYPWPPDVAAGGRGEPATRVGD